MKTGSEEPVFYVVIKKSYLFVIIHISCILEEI